MTALTFFLSLLAAAGVLFGFYAAVLGFFGLRGQTAKPKFGLLGAEGGGGLAFWLKWDPSVYAISAYRFMVQVYSPHAKEKESRFTVTLNPPPKGSFLQPVILPATFKNLLEDKKTPGSATMVTISLRTTDEVCIQKNYSLGRLRKLLSKTGTVKGVTKLEPLGADEASVTTLDFEELTARNEKLSKLEAQAKAKAAAAEKAKQAAAEKAKAAAAKPKADESNEVKNAPKKTASVQEGKANG